MCRVAFLQASLFLFSRATPPHLHASLCTPITVPALSISTPVDRWAMPFLSSLTLPPVAFIFSHELSCDSVISSLYFTYTDLSLSLFFFHFLALQVFLVHPNTHTRPPSLLPSFRYSHLPCNYVWYAGWSVMAVSIVTACMGPKQRVCVRVRVVWGLFRIRHRKKTLWSLIDVKSWKSIYYFYSVSVCGMSDHICLLKCS